MATLAAKGKAVQDELSGRTQNKNRERVVSVIAPEDLDALAAAEPWLGPVCSKLRELIATDLSRSHFAYELLRYIAEALPASKSVPWRAMLEDHQISKR